MIPESLSTTVKLLPMIFLIYINNTAHNSVSSSLSLVSFCMSEGLSNKFPSPEVNTRGNQAHGRAVTHAI